MLPTSAIPPQVNFFSGVPGATLHPGRDPAMRIAPGLSGTIILVGCEYLFRRNSCFPDFLAGLSEKPGKTCWERDQAGKYNNMLLRSFSQSIFPLLSGMIFAVRPSRYGLPVISW